ncbi:uncharacterized protein LOC121396960 [Xenopus laevis]|uniref:Uncharacterized protein LOC121396960 n=1 Tax=Xenopus laevis TaxID=8355 RepID=A0A8J1LG99_XENLA|nr:uncharacterized protein LOC121396960 [Xenopus laevis]
MKEISWLYEQAIIVTTQQNGSLTVRSPRFRQRVYSGSAGSLIITELTKKDQGTYSANVEGRCTDFYLQVFKPLSAEDIQIHHRIINMENCSLTLSCNVTGPETRSFWENREASDGIKGNITLHVIYTNASSKYTCTAQNQISRVSRSVIPWTLCREVSESNETRPETQYIRATLVVFVPCFIIISAIISVYVWARHRHQLGKSFLWSTSPVSDENSILI